jgi:hypothetical protein
MKHELAREVMACLPKGRTLFHYSKDDYAFLLLNLMSKKESRIQKLRHSPVARLLEKPAIKPHLALCSDGSLHPGFVPRQQFLPSGRTYRLTLDIWGDDLEYWRYNQVSRKGVSLVLQLNMTGSHQKELSKCLSDKKDEPFCNYGHPARNGEFPTLAWCRLDFDLETGEALIEEIQSDLLRELRSSVNLAYEARTRKKDRFDWHGYEFKTSPLIDYWEKDFSAHEKTWHEAMLTAALQFLFDELGMKTVYYHTAASGKFLKRIGGTAPPASLYTSLPRQFCFENTKEAPVILQGDKLWKRRVRAAREPLEFFRMAV